MLIEGVAEKSRLEVGFHWGFRGSVLGRLNGSRIVGLALCARTPAKARTRSTREAREIRD